MTVHQTLRIFISKQKQNSILTTFVGLFAFITIGIDFLFAKFHNGAFYISESLLFSSYWFIFLPFLNIQWKLSLKNNKKYLVFLVAGLLIAAHLFFYPAIIWLLSKVLYNHTFSYSQTFHYGVTAYFIKTLLIYGLLPLFTILNRLTRQPAIVENQAVSLRSFLTSIVVSESNKKLAIATDDILYFSASSPYVSIHHLTKKYLHITTLKSLEAQLDEQQFIRIHKSCIVNLNKVVSFESRLNGDYDITLTDGTVLRVSRNYAAAFKARFQQAHQLAPK